MRPGETVPVDGTLFCAAMLDESSLTGESEPIAYGAGALVLSSIVNAGNAFDMLATSSADDSTFSGIIRLVREAGATRAPAACLANRYALPFVLLALGMAARSSASRHPSVPAPCPEARVHLPRRDHDRPEPAVTRHHDQRRAAPPVPPGLVNANLNPAALLEHHRRAGRAVAMAVD